MSAGPLAILLGQDRIPPGGCSLLAVTEQGFGLGGQLVLGILQQPLAVAGELARRQIVAVNAGFICSKPGVLAEGWVWGSSRRDNSASACWHRPGLGLAAGSPLPR